MAPPQPVDSPSYVCGTRFAPNAGMDTVLRKHFWLVLLLLLSGAAYATAQIASALLAAPDALPAGGDASEESAPAARAPKDAGAVLARNIFNSDPQRPPPPAPEGGTVTASGPTEEADLGVELVAVIDADRPASSFAHIRERSSEDASVFRIGDRLRGDAEIVRIEWRRVLVWHNGRLESLTLFGGPPRKSPPPPLPTPGAGIRQVGELAYRVAPARAKQLLRLEGILTGARVVPVFEQGKVAGFRLAQVRPDGPCAAIGLRPGDVLQRLNGQVVDSLEKALAAHESLKSAREVTIDIVRGGIRRTLSYSIGE
jgi:type II secretion system protein C